MAQADYYNDTTPRLTFQRPSAPTVAQLKSALTTFNATSYTADRLNAMTERDLVYAARVHGLTVAAPNTI